MEDKDERTGSKLEKINEEEKSPRTLAEGGNNDEVADDANNGRNQDINDQQPIEEQQQQIMDAQQPTRNERAMGLHSIPKPNTNLKPLLRGGSKLWKDTKPLKPLIHAEWISMDTSSPNNFHGTLRFILQEGKKHQIRRMCREILGMHVIQLQRIRIGPVHLHDLPEGKWRYVSYNYTHLYCRCN